MLIQTESLIVKLCIAIVLGLVLGYERARAGKVVGMRTYALVTLAATLFVGIGVELTDTYVAQGFNFDPFRIASSVVAGVGFLGAGLMIFQNTHVRNVTTAAVFWVASAVGVAVGFGLYMEATVATFATLLVLMVLVPFENKITEQSHKGHKCEPKKKKRG